MQYGGLQLKFYFLTEVYNFMFRVFRSAVHLSYNLQIVVWNKLTPCKVFDFQDVQRPGQVWLSGPTSHGRVEFRSGFITAVRRRRQR